jgi:integrase
MGRKPATRTRVHGPYPHRKRWRLLVIEPGGRVVPRSFETREKAVAWKRELRRHLAAEGISVSDALREYEADQVRRELRPNTIATASFRLKAILDLEDDLVELTPSKAQRLYDALVDTGCAVDTHRGSLATARAFAAWAVKRGWLSSNPFEGIDGVGKKRAGKKQLRIDEAKKFARACVAEAVELGAGGGRQRGAAAAALCCLLLGLRATETCNVRARDLDAGGTLLWFDEQDELKTENARRRVQVPAMLQPILKKLAAAPLDGSRLFPGDRHWLGYHVRRLCKVAAVMVITPHSLRGLHATLATAAGTTGDAVALSLGHSSSAVTNRHYTSEEAQEAAKIDRALDALGLEDDNE